VSKQERGKTKGENALLTAMSLDGQSLPPLLQEWLFPQDGSTRDLASLQVVLGRDGEFMASDINGKVEGEATAQSPRLLRASTMPPAEISTRKVHRSTTLRSVDLSSSGNIGIARKRASTMASPDLRTTETSDNGGATSAENTDPRTGEGDGAQSRHGISSILGALGASRVSRPLPLVANGNEASSPNEGPILRNRRIPVVPSASRDTHARKRSLAALSKPLVSDNTSNPVMKELPLASMMAVRPLNLTRKSSAANLLPQSNMKNVVGLDDPKMTLAEREVPQSSTPTTTAIPETMPRARNSLSSHDRGDSTSIKSSSRVSLNDTISTERTSMSSIRTSTSSSSLTVGYDAVSKDKCVCGYHKPERSYSDASVQTDAQPELQPQVTMYPRFDADGMWYQSLPVYMEQNLMGSAGEDWAGADQPYDGGAPIGSMADYFRFGGYTLGDAMR